MKRKATIPTPCTRKPRNPKPETRNPKPETRNPKPEIRNPKPETSNLKPENRTRHPKPETRNPKPDIQVEQELEMLREILEDLDWEQPEAVRQVNRV